MALVNVTRVGGAQSASAKAVLVLVSIVPIMAHVTPMNSSASVALAGLAMVARFPIVQGLTAMVEASAMAILILPFAETVRVAGWARLVSDLV